MRTARKGAFALCAVALTIAALMTFAVPSAAYANEGWTYDPTTHTLTSSSGVTLNNVTAADSALTIGDNRNRDDLGPSLDLQGEIESEFTITAIGSYAFSGCTSLESVKIPDGVETIGDRAFYDCTSLTSVTIPASVEAIGGYAFSDCSSLTSICVDGDNGKYSSKEGVLFSDGGGTLVRFPGRRGGQYEIPDNVTAIGNHAFDGCTSLASVKIPASVKTIGDSAFAGCSSLTSMTIPSSVEAIGGFAFSGCISLKSVTIPDSVTAIGGSAFYSCSSLTSVTIPNSVETIGSSTFAHCSSLASVTIPSSVETIGDSAFNGCSSLTSVTIPDSVEAIGGYAFAYCSSLESICVDGGNESYSSIDGVLFSDGGETLVCFPGGRDGQYEIPSSVETIRADAFSGCSSLESVTIPAGVEAIEDFAFSGCISLKSICVEEDNESYSSSTDGVLFKKSGGTLTLVCFPGGKGGRYEVPDNVTAIGNYAFFGCSSLTSVEIPAGVTSIGVSAFNGCASLERVTVLAESPPTLDAGVFASCASNLTIVVPADSLETYSENNNWNGLADNLTAGYPLKVQDESGIELDSGLYAEDDEVQVSANVEVGEGQHVKWVLLDENGQPATVTYNTLTMPNRNATVICEVESHSFSGRYCVCGAENPNYVPPAPTYSSEVTVSDNGTASVSPARASAGQKVTVACSPSEGFEVRSVLVSGRDGEPVEATDNGDGTWTFVMPDEGAEVSVVFGCDGGALCPSAGYSDVDQSLWYHDAVDAVVSAGLMTGYADGSGLFGPDDAPTRAQAATVLFRALGTDAKAPACGMADVDPSAWYAGPVDWAVSSGIMVGYGDGSGRFGVDDVLTREQLATVLWRAAGSPDAGAYDDSAFSDGGDASEWAEPALAWAVGAGVLRGSDDSSGGTELRPTAAITRAEMAAMLERWLLLG